MFRDVFQPWDVHLYNAKDVEDTIVALTEKVAGSGYAFAQVTPRTLLLPILARNHPGLNP